MSSTDPSAAGTVVAVLGTGTIGAPMARNLARAGFAVRAWNRTRTKAEPLAADGATGGDSAADAVRDADVVVTVLPDGPRTLDAVREATPKPGTVWVQSGTVGEGIDELAEYAARAGLLLVDAPVLGTRQPAEQGTLTVLAAGADTTRASAQPIFDATGSPPPGGGAPPPAADPPADLRPRRPPPAGGRRGQSGRGQPPQARPQLLGARADHGRRRGPRAGPRARRRRERPGGRRPR